MGNIFHDIFGGSESKQKSESGNYSYPYIQQTYGSMAGLGAPSTGEYAGLLGLGDGDPAAFEKYKNSDGYNFLLDSGSKAITGNAAARGLLKSGSTLKALDTFGQNLGSTQLQSYLGNLSDLSKLSLGAGGLISGAGNYSQGTSKSDSETGAFGTFLGALMASDIRLKDNVQQITTLPDGLPVYSFDYRRDLDPSLPEGRQIGVMAHEVAVKQPWALGPVRDDGYSTVDYGKITPSIVQAARFL